MVEQLVRDAHENGPYTGVFVNHIDTICKGIWSRKNHEDYIKKAIATAKNDKRRLTAAWMKLVDEHEIKDYPSNLVSQYQNLQRRAVSYDIKEASDLDPLIDYWQNKTDSVSNSFFMTLHVANTYHRFIKRLDDDLKKETISLLKSINNKVTRGLVAVYGTDLIKEGGDIDTYLSKIKSLMNDDLRKNSVDADGNEVKEGYDYRSFFSDDHQDHEIESAYLFALIKGIVLRGNNVPMPEILRRFEEKHHEHIDEQARLEQKILEKRTNHVSNYLAEGHLVNGKSDFSQY